MVVITTTGYRETGGGREVDGGRDRWGWLAVDAETAARRLLGCELESVVETPDGEVALRARIVETEAYDETDPASHCFRGPTPRNAAMFLSAGHAYVYLNYGIHRCLNIVCGVAGVGSGVLVRAVEPIAGIEEMRRRRGPRGLVGHELSNGPGKVGAALGIDLDLSGHDLATAPLTLHRHAPGAGPEAGDIAVTPRIGITRAVDAPRRFHLRSSPWVSRP